MKGQLSKAQGTDVHAVLFLNLSLPRTCRGVDFHGAISPTLSAPPPGILGVALNGGALRNLPVALRKLVS